MAFLGERRLVAEQMDADDVDPRELAKALRFIRRINALLRYNASMAKAVERVIDSLSTNAMPISVLDVAAGSGDLLVELSRRATRAGRTLDCVGLDRHAKTIEQSSTGSAATAGIRFIRGDATALPFDDQSVDVVTSTLFLHHLPEAIAVAALKEMRRVARHTVIVADLMRDRRAYAWITLFTLFSSPMVKHDARASVSHAFTMDEARSLAHAAGMADASWGTTFGHRFVMTWRRRT